MDKQEIGKAFKEQLKKLDQTPNDLVWNKIAAQLDQKKKRKKPFFLWKLTGIAAAFLLLFSIGYQLFSTNKNTIITNTNINKSKSKQINNVVKTTKDSLLFNANNKLLVANTTKQNNNNSTQINKQKYKQNAKIKNQIEQTNLPKLKIKNKQIKLTNLTSNEQLYVKSKKVDENLKTKNSNINKKQIEENQIEENQIVKKNNLLAKNLNVKQKEKKINKKFKKEDLKKTNDKQIINKKINSNKWEIAMKAAPVFYGSMANGSSLDASLDNNSTSSLVTLSYGLLTSYKVNNKLKIRTGLHKLNLANTTNNVSTNTILNSESLALSNLESFIDVNAITQPTQKFEINQKISYFEIPIELNYNLMSKKIGVDLISGFSTLILDRNTIIIDNQTVGKAVNLKSTSFTGNFGLGLNYKINKKINFNLEPILKIQLDAFENSVDNKPYFFGVYSGFSYQF